MGCTYNINNMAAKFCFNERRSTPGSAVQPSDGHSIYDGLDLHGIANCRAAKDFLDT
jgi:hypothetical protein